jgi:pleiotropic regulator 1
MGLQDKTIRIYDIEKDIYLNTLKGTPKGFPNALLGLN